MRGVLEAEACALHCQKYDFDIAFTSKLERAHATLSIILAQQNRTGIIQHENEGSHYKWTCDSNFCLPDDIPVYESATLNERYYGKLQGIGKKAAEKKFGVKKVFEWRRGYDARPPGGESLKEAHGRVIPFFLKKIQPRLRKGETVLLCAHGNTLRAIIKRLEGISDHEIAYIDLPKAKPLVYEYSRGRFRRVAGEYELNRPLR
jgi:2,3-bisphosphoglycerate-dependent phosphoglycerate mutase